MQRLEQRLTDFVAFSRPWIIEHEAASTEPDSLTSNAKPDLDPKRFAELLTALSENNSRARRLFSELQPALNRRLGVAACQAFGALIRDLRFEEALAALQDPNLRL